MSTKRTSKGGWVDPDELPREENGRALCRRCGSPVPSGRRSFCSKSCVHEWRMRTDPGYARQQVFQRDQGICAKCRKDVFADEFHGNGSVRKRRARGSGDLWQADHIKPVVEGGGECGLDNLRTLCTACHKAETKGLAGRSKARRAALRTLPLLDYIAI